MSDVELIRGWRRDGQRHALEPSSLRRREDDVRCFARWLGSGLLSATEADVQAFIDNRVWHGQPIAARSRYRWVSELATFYTWCQQEELIAADPTVRVIRPRLHRLLPRPCSTEDMELAVVAGDPAMRCWLLLAAYAGFRCCEIARLERDDVRGTWHPKVLVAYGKGSKDRAVPLHPRVLDALTRLPLPRRGFVFVKGRGGAYPPAVVSSRISDHFRSLGMSWTAHQGRHWYGVNLLVAAGGDLRLVQEMLGHESITSTTIYTGWSQVQAAKAVAALPWSDDE